MRARGRFSKGRNFPNLAELNASCVCDILRIVMCPDKTHLATNLRRVFGSAPPEKITQEAYEGNPKHLRRLARLRRGEKAEVSDLWKYTQDLLYTEIEGPLFAYLLPFCLEAWREDLRGTSSEYGGFVEQFYPVVANRQVFDRLLTPAQSTAVSDFMRRSILEEIDDQRGLAYRGERRTPVSLDNRASDARCSAPRCRASLGRVVVG